MGQYLSIFDDQDCVVVNSTELVDSVKDSHTFTKTKHFLFLLLTLSRHSLEHFHMVLQSPCYHLDFVMKDFLTPITADFTAIFICVILLNVSG